jgi:hypothetical protein
MNAFHPSIIPLWLNIISGMTHAFIFGMLWMHWVGSLPRQARGELETRGLVKLISPV